MKLFEIMNPSNVKTFIQFHDELNPKLWEGKELKLDVKHTLERIANEFLEFLEINPDSIEDIIITGSNCGYNYTQFSDIDLHLVVNLEKIDVECEDFINMYFQAKKTIWNDSHDISIRRIPVELYAQDSKETHISAGEYSILHDRWISSPKHENFKYDDHVVKVKSSDIMNRIDSIIDNKEDDIDNIKKLKAKIKNMRKSGLQKHGEGSVENLVFKTLRNNGYLDKLSDYQNSLEDDRLSLN